VSNWIDNDHPDRMRKKALELRARACIAEKSSYAEQLIGAAEDLESYALEVEGRGCGNTSNTKQA
jgi:hypothetical protein